MKTMQDLHNERLNRIKAAVALEKPDRVPVVPLATAFCARHLGVSLQDFALNPEISTETIIKSLTSLGEFDGVQPPFFYPHAMSTHFLAKIQIPGINLPDNIQWQVTEVELMTIEDYDTIINKGYHTFFNEFQAKYLDNVIEKLESVGKFAPEAIKRWQDIGIPVMSGTTTGTPYELFCAGRTMSKFTKDLFKIPDKVEAAMDAALVDTIIDVRNVCRKLKPFGAWIGGWRTASAFLSPQKWERFVWPYFKKLAETLLEEGVTPILHLDSDWERDLKYFLELPKGKCIISPDNATNIYKIKEVLGNHMCIMGDVPAALFKLGTPDEVHAYSTKLINEIGPTGFILSSGCDIPMDAKPENVAAMMASVK